MTATAKHTPGPWGLDKYGTGITDKDGFGLADASEILVLDSWDKKKVKGKRVQHWADVPGVTHREISEEEAEANARLIAAAPDLLATCRKLVQVLGISEVLHVASDYNNAGKSAKKWLVEARATIAHAEGR